MKKPDITPGPWHLQSEKNGGIHHDGGRWVKTNGLFSVRVIGGEFVSRHKPRIEDEERDANARAIAALPELLEALEKCHAFTMGQPENRELQPLHCAVTAALLKAGYTLGARLDNAHDFPHQPVARQP